VSSAKIIQIGPDDNVAIALRDLQAGDIVGLGGRLVRVLEPILSGHKVALRDLVAGEKIIRYNMPIGSASENIACGAHVHMHNLKSDYIPTRTLD